MFFVCLSSDLKLEGRGEEGVMGVFIRQSKESCQCWPIRLLAGYSLHIKRLVAKDCSQLSCLYFVYCYVYNLI